jgi:hypothetical protein
MEYKPSVGLPGRVPGRDDPHSDAVPLAALTMIIIVFFALIGQGCSPREAVTVTIALGMGAVETARRLVKHRDHRSGRR